jgi:hypothetical protein
MARIRHLARISVTVATAACLLTAASACSEDGEAAPDVPYDREWSETSGLCESFPANLPDGFFLDGIETEADESGCGVGQHADKAYRHLSFEINRQYTSDWRQETDDEFASRAGNNPIPVEGLGEDAALVAGHQAPSVPETEVVPPAYSPDYDQLFLIVQEENLVIQVEVFSGYQTDEIGPRAVPLDELADAVIATGEWLLGQIDAEPREAQISAGGSDAGIAVLPDLCPHLDLEGMQPAADGPESPDYSDVMGQCHWRSDAEADLWLNAEAVAPLEYAGMSAEEFAAWWTTSTPEAAGDPLDLGDEAYVLEVDVDSDRTGDAEIPASDFVIRIGNVVLQGRYSDGTEGSRVVAEGLASAINDQVQSLLSGG